MIAALFGSETAEKVILFIAYVGEGHIRGIASNCTFKENGHVELANGYENLKKDNATPTGCSYYTNFRKRKYECRSRRRSRCFNLH
jgi:hypothetical protein